MPKRFTDTEIWDKEWFMKLSPKLKCLVKVVRDKCDLSGVWSPNWIIISAYIGESVTEKELLSIDNGNQFVKTDGGKIFCIGFVEFQYGELSEKSPVHRKIINLLKTHKIDYKHPINRVQEEEEEKEEEKDKDKEEEKEEDQPPIIKIETEDSLVEMLKTDSTWIYGVSSQFKINQEDVSVWLDSFVLHRSINKTAFNGRRDYLVHFNNWLRKQDLNTGEKKNKAPGSTKSGMVY